MVGKCMSTFHFRKALAHLCNMCQHLSQMPLVLFSSVVFCGSYDYVAWYKKSPGNWTLGKVFGLARNIVTLIKSILISPVSALYPAISTSWSNSSIQLSQIWWTDTREIFPTSMVDGGRRESLAVWIDHQSTMAVTVSAIITVWRPWQSWQLQANLMAVVITRLQDIKSIAVFLQWGPFFRASLIQNQT